MDFPFSGPLTPKRRGVVLAFATVLELISYWALLRGLVAIQDGSRPEIIAPSLFIGMVTIPIVFVVIAFGSRHANAPVATLQAMGLCLVVGLPVAFVIPSVGLLAGFGVGGTIALRHEEWQLYRVRLAAVGLACLYVVVLMVIVLPVGVFTAGFLPFLALEFADRFSDSKNEHGSPPSEGTPSNDGNTNG